MQLIHMRLFYTVMTPIKRHTIVSSAVIYPSLKLQRMLVIDHLTLFSVLEAVLDGRGMPSHGKRMKLVGLQHNIYQFLEGGWKQYLLQCPLLSLPNVSLKLLSLLLNNVRCVFEICNEILISINR
jgi:hypothetical protein